MAKTPLARWLSLLFGDMGNYKRTGRQLSARSEIFGSYFNLVIYWV